MRPTKQIGLSSVARQRRKGLVGIGIMIAVLTGLVLYQRFAGGARPLEGRENAAKAPTADQVVADTPPEYSSQSAEVDSVNTTTSAITRLSRPFPGQWQIVKRFGSVDDAMGDYRLYAGIAIAAEPGTLAAATAKGRITLTEENPIEGWVVVIDHGSGLQTRYAGLRRPLVQNNASVLAGQALGEVGPPTLSRKELGPHLMLQILSEGVPVDPESYLGK